MDERRPTREDAPDALVRGSAAIPSDAMPRRRTWGRRALGVLAALVLLTLANVLATLLLDPYGSLSEVRWSEYRSVARGGIDTIVVGSSVSERSVDLRVLDGTLRAKSFSLSSSAQSLEDSYIGIEQAIRDHHVKRAVLGVDYASFSEGSYPNARMAYLLARCEGQSLGYRASALWGLMGSHEFVGTSQSLNFLFPWAFNRVGMSPRAVVQNLRQRLDGTTQLEAAQERDPQWHYQGKGYGNYDFVIDYANAKELLFSSQYGKKPFREDTLDALRRICDLCRRNGVELTVVVAPCPTFNVLCYGDYYPQQMPRAQKIVTDAGFRFLDFNLARSSAYVADESDFLDGEHLNVSGAARFTKSFGELLARSEAGEGLSQHFYSYDRWDEYLASIDRLSAVTLDEEPVEGAVRVTATPYAGLGRRVEYQFYVGERGSDATELVRDWSEDPVFDLPVTGHGEKVVYVRARLVGSTAEFDRRSNVLVTY